ncbi:MAG: exodeoxyribonuclease VII small subunit [Phycisphaerales bacterium]
MASGEPVNTGTLSYEQAVSRLEAIVERIESGEIGLDESMALYEEGVKLGKRCKEALLAAEQRIEVLSRETAGLEAGQKSSTLPGTDDKRT